MTIGKAVTQETVVILKDKELTRKIQNVLMIFPFNSTQMFQQAYEQESFMNQNFLISVQAINLSTQNVIHITQSFPLGILTGIGLLIK